jgi:hypothetical protein
MINPHLFACWGKLEKKVNGATTTQRRLPRQSISLHFLVARRYLKAFQRIPSPLKADGNMYVIITYMSLYVHFHNVSWLKQEYDILKNI